MKTKDSIKKEKNENKSKPWRGRDWIWTVIVLCIVIVFLLSFVIRGEVANNALSVGATISSIALSLTTIAYSVIQNSSTDAALDKLYYQLDHLLEEKRNVVEVANAMTDEKITKLFEKMEKADALSMDEKEVIKNLQQTIDKNEVKKIKYTSVFDIMSE